MASAGRRSRTPDEARLVERFKRLAPQQQALLLALAPFQDDSGRPDRKRWAERFESDQPEDIVAIKAATGLYEGLVNHLAEMLLVAAKLRGLAVAQRDDRPSGPELFAAVGADGGLTDSQVTVLRRLYATRNELQHASPGIEAGQVFDDVQLLLKTLKRFVASYIAWLKQHDIALV
jgi:hypothetical protein